MPKRDYESLRDEDKAWIKLKRPALMLSLLFISLVILTATIISLNIVFPSDPAKRPFCGDRRIEPLQINTKHGDLDSMRGVFYLTDAETVDYFWMVLFVPTAVVFAISSVYLIAGMLVAYSAPTRHGCLKVVENNFCASRRGGVRCLAILNIIFAIVFGLLALFLGSSLLTLGSNCAIPLFWCYELASWGLVILYAGTSFFLRRKAAAILDEGELGTRNLGLEMLETNPLEITPDVERRVNDGFKSWMGSSFLSSDEEEDDPESYTEAPQHGSP